MYKIAHVYGAYDYVFKEGTPKKNGLGKIGRTYTFIGRSLFSGTPIVVMSQLCGRCHTVSVLHSVLHRSLHQTPPEEHQRSLRPERISEPRLSVLSWELPEAERDALHA